MAKPSLFYTYVHRQADDGSVFYVGKGKGQRAWSTAYRNNFWTNVFKAHGIVVQIVGEFANEANAFKSERALIAMFRAAGCRLVNATDGGEGPSGAKRSDETKRKMSEASKGRRRGPLSDATRAKMSASAKGRPMSPEAIAKTAAAHRGRKRSPETLARMSDALRGKKRSPRSAETTAKLITALTGKKRSPEAKAKMSAAARGKPKGPQSPEHKARIGEARRKAWAIWREQRDAS